MIVSREAIMLPMEPKPFIIVPRWPLKVYKPRESFVYTPEMQGKVWGIVLADGAQQEWMRETMNG